MTLPAFEKRGGTRSADQTIGQRSTTGITRRPGPQSPGNLTQSLPLTAGPVKREHLAGPFLFALLLLTACIRQPTTPPSPVPSAAPAASCGEDWRTRVRRPERFTQVARCVTFTAVVRAVKREADGDLHAQLVLEGDARQYLNARNMAAQHGTLVMEIEPWEHGAQTRSADPTHVNNHPPAPYCPADCSPRAGDRLLVTSAIVTDNEPNHGWNEAHSPWDVVVVGHGVPPEGDVPADPTEPD